MPQQRARREPAAGAGHESPGVGACSTQMEAPNRTAVARVTEQRSHREQLVQRELSMKHVPTAQPGLRLQFWWR